MMVVMSDAVIDISVILNLKHMAWNIPMRHLFQIIFIHYFVSRRHIWEHIVSDLINY